MKKFFDAVFIVGLIFSFVGALFIVLGIIFHFNIDYLLEHGSGDVEYLPIIFGGMGLLFFAVGMFSLISRIVRNKKIQSLISNGNYILAEFICTSLNKNIRINGRCPYNVECQYFDSYSGLQYIFKSENIFFDPGIPDGTMLKVYVQENNMKRYYVDISSFTGEMENPHS